MVAQSDWLPMMIATGLVMRFGCLGGRRGCIGIRPLLASGQVSLTLVSQAARRNRGGHGEGGPSKGKIRIAVGAAARPCAARRAAADRACRACPERADRACRAAR